MPQALNKGGSLLWEPSDHFKATSNIAQYMKWLEANKGLSFKSYEELWRWSVENIASFWESLWDYFSISSSKPYSKVLERDEGVFGAKWFTGSELNYSEHVFRNMKHLNSEDTAIIFASEGSESRRRISWNELERSVASLAASLKEMGIKRGDRVAAYVPNTPETVISFLAVASLGAIWSSCSPDFGVSSVVERFKQIEPKLLIAVDGYAYNNKKFDRLDAISQIQKSLPSLTYTVLIPNLQTADQSIPGTLQAKKFGDLLLLHKEAKLDFEQVPFDHPLWILFSSGTTGPPKSIVQGHGGILLEQLKLLSLHTNLKPGDRFFWFTTTGWMMWNVVVSGLLVGTTIVLYDGSPSYPDTLTLWKLAEEVGITVFGTSAAFISACIKAGTKPRDHFALKKLVNLSSTGSPLSAEGFSWVYQNVSENIWLASVSGGTDLCTAFVGGCPILPVYSGEIQCRCLGAKVEAYNETGLPVVDEMGELVITQPMPSMPVSFWGDPEGKRYSEAYFEMFPGVWKHGDWIEVTKKGTCVIYGRSDSTIKRFGVRMGSAEIYRVVEAMPEVLESLVVDLEGLGGESKMLLFVVPKSELSEEARASLTDRIKYKIDQDISRRHVPDEFYFVKEIPKTLNGKKMEVPVRRILMGTPPEKAVNIGSMSNPHVLDFFVALASERRQKEKS